MTPPATTLPPFEFSDLLLPVGLWIAGCLLLLALAASGHAVIYKREARSASLWFILIWILPGLGTLLYVILGINRVRRRASRLRRKMTRHRTDAHAPADAVAVCSQSAPHFVPLMQLVDRVVPRPLVGGNSITPLVRGSEAYPAMLAAIESARTSVGLASYIFDGRGIGERFVEALHQAQGRGVAVRVLIDDFEARFSASSAAKPLRRAGIKVGIFNPPLVPARLNAIHLRNHRKILVVDGAIGFTGGLNIDERYWNPSHPDAACGDVHFRLEGPVVAHLAEVFADDWQFTTGEALRGNRWFPPLDHRGPTLARGVEAGPDESADGLRWTMIGALNAARHSIQIATPYFIPDATLISALNAAALRGVAVDIVLPRRSDLRHVQWATMGQLWQVLERGCRVWSHPGPFEHTKLLLVDEAWTLLGSANWDARSLRLNFEFNVECYCQALGAQLAAQMAERRARSQPVTLHQVNARPLGCKLRDGAARMFAPYL